MTAKTPPKSLSKEARRLWLKLNREFDFEPENLILLKTCLEAYDRLKEARELLDREGLTVPAATGGVKAHPGLQAEKMARSGFLQAWRMLQLEIEPPNHEIGRPPGRFLNKERR